MRRLTSNIAVSFLLHVLLVLPLLLIFRSSPTAYDRPLTGGQGVTVEVVGREYFSDPTSGPTRRAAKPQALHASTLLLPGSGSGDDSDGANTILSDIRKRIESAKRYPELARRAGIEGKSLVSFRINESGQPVEIVLKASSGSEILDQESLATVRRAAPFPEYQQTLEIGIRFEHETP